MEQMGFLIEIDKCVGCRACEIACKIRNKLGPGARLRVTHTLESGNYLDCKVANVSMSCMHCESPACAQVCPTGAITKNPVDGIVMVDKDKCIGCHYCFFACPFAVPQYHNKTMLKCDMCADRREMGLEPACTQMCMYDALHSGTLSELAEIVRERHAYRLAGSTSPSVFMAY
jgi:anaerobic dimethyl sulfoxide reductase subunit B (iron-sulfur subunit)